MRKETPTAEEMTRVLNRYAPGYDTIVTPNPRMVANDTNNPTARIWERSEVEWGDVVVDQKQRVSVLINVLDMEFGKFGRDLKSGEVRRVKYPVSIVGAIAAKNSG